jgi:hypothetical protein
VYKPNQLGERQYDLVALYRPKSPANAMGDAAALRALMDDGFPHACSHSNMRYRTPLPLRETLLLLLLGLRAHHLDREEPEARQERLGIIADAVSDASLRATCSEQYATEDCKRHWPLSPLDLGVLLVTQAYLESTLAKNVHEGNCRSYECDPIRIVGLGQIRHRARSLWQIHRISPIESEWEHMQGSDLQSTTAAAWAAAKLLGRGYRACSSIAGAVTRFAGVEGCEWSEAPKRARMYTALRQRASQIERACKQTGCKVQERGRPGPNTRTSMR